MSAGRGTQTTEEVRASLLTFMPTLRIWGAEGEEQEEPKEDPEGEPTGEQEELEEESEEDPKEPTAEELLEAERKENIKLKKQLKKEQDAKDKAAGDKDVTKDRDKYKSENDKLRDFLDDNLLTFAVTKNKKFEWENEDDVLKFINTDAVSIDLEGKKVEGLDLELKRIAKEKPYLLKKKKEEQEEEAGPPSGSKIGGGKAGSVEAENERLGKKFKIPGYGTQGTRLM